MWEKLCKLKKTHSTSEIVFPTIPLVAEQEHVKELLNTYHIPLPKALPALNTAIAEGGIFPSSRFGSP